LSGWFLVGVLAVWRVAHLVVAEDGPWDIVVRVRRVAGASVIGRLMDCFHCASLWVAAPFAFGLGTSAHDWLLLWPALSAGAILLERLTAGRATPPAAYVEGEDMKEADR